MVSPGQVNYLIPGTVAIGNATISLSANSNTFTGKVDISNVAPSIFSAASSGSGPAAAQVLTVTASGQVTTTNIFTTGAYAGGTDYIPTPVSLSPITNQVYLILYGTGFRNHSANPVEVTINGVSVPVTYAGAQSTLPGLDQINVGPLPQTLAGTGKANLTSS